MRLLLLSVEYPPGPGGLGTQAFQVASGLHRLGWQVKVASPQTHASESDIQAFNQAQPFEVIRLPFFGLAFFEGIDRLVRLFRLLRRFRPQVILGIGRESAWLGALLSRLAGLPFAQVAAGSEILSGGPGRRALTRWSLHQAQAVFPVSQYVAGLVRALELPAERVQVIPCGADEGVFRPGLPVADLRHQLGVGQARVLLTVGRSTARKGQQVVLQALPEVLESVPGVVYLMVGLPEEQADLQAQAEALRIAEYVRFMGVVPRARLPLYYSLADLFLLLSLEDRGQVEGFGISVVEAALCGVPALVSDHGGLPETVLPGETGLIVPAGDAYAVSQAILRLLTDEPLRQRLGAAARHQALQHATWTQRVRVYHQSLQRLLGDR